MSRPRTFQDEAVLEVARQCFLETGPETSVGTIAERVGVSAAALFQRFKTKRELMARALLPEHPPDLFAIVDADPDDRPPLEQLSDITVRMAEIIGRRLPGVMLLRASGIRPADVHPDHEPTPWVARQALTRWLRVAQERELIARGDASQMADAIMCCVEAYALHAQFNPMSPEDRERKARAATEVLWHGFAPTRGTP